MVSDFFYKKGVSYSESEKMETIVYPILILNSELQVFSNNKCNELSEEEILYLGTFFNNSPGLIIKYYNENFFKNYENLINFFININQSNNNPLVYEFIHSKNKKNDENLLILFINKIVKILLIYDISGNYYKNLSSLEKKLLAGTIDMVYKK